MATETTNKEDTKPMTISSPFHLINQTKTSNLELKTKAMNIQSVILHRWGSCEFRTSGNV